jgi:hypothetical protein
LLALTLAAVPAVAQVPPQPRHFLINDTFVLPPKEYDKPYIGALIVIYARDQDHVRELCPDVNFVGAAIACAIRGEESCFVAIAPDADIAAAGATHWLVMRHEMGHCNGWRGHSGARSRLAELPFASDNVVDTVSQFDNFARNAVGKTVAQVANTLAKSDWTAAKFVLAAKGIGRASDDQVNKEILSNPDTARSLARAAGIGARHRISGLESAPKRRHCWC